MYINVMFLSYIAASFAALLSLSLVLLLISKGRAVKSDKYRTAMGFAITVVAVSILYFFMYYRDVYYKDYDVALGVRVVDYFLYGVIFALWLRAINVMMMEQKKSLNLFSWIIGLTLSSVGVLGTIFFMDSTYAFENIAIAEKYFLVEAGITVLLVIVTIKYSLDFIRETLVRSSGIYVGIVSATLMVWAIEQLVVDYNLYFGEYISGWSQQMPEITSAAMTIVGVANFVFFFREDFSPQFYITEDAEIPEEDLDMIQIAAIQHHLTVREEEVLRLAYEGKNNPEIAAELFISINTVKKHIKNIYEKFGVSSRMELVYMVNKGSDDKILK